MSTENSRLLPELPVREPFRMFKELLRGREITWVNRIRCYISQSLLFSSQRDVIKFKALFSATLFHFHKYSNGIEALFTTAIKTKTWFSSRGFIFSVLLHRIRQWCRLNPLHPKFYDILEALEVHSEFTWRNAYQKSKMIFCLCRRVESWTIIIDTQIKLQIFQKYLTNEKLWTFECTLCRIAAFLFFRNFALILL